MKIFFYFILSLFFFSCRKHIIEDELQFNICNIETNKNSNINKNIITFYIENISNKKLFMALNEDELEPFTQERISSKEFSRKAKFGFLLELDNGKYLSHYTIIGSNSNNLNSKCELIKILNMKKKLIDLNYPKNFDFEFAIVLKNNSFILHPNEKKYFRVILNLPRFKTIDDNGYISEFKLDKNVNYKLSLFYANDSLLTKKNLPSYKLDEIKENDVQIYNGINYSNKIIINYK